MWKIGQIQCVFPIFSALNGNFNARFSPPRVVFAMKTENEGVPARSVQISFALKTFRQCTFYAGKCLKSQVFHTVSAPGCLYPLQKLLFVSCGLVTLGVTPYTGFSRLHTRVRLYFWCPLGQISTFSHFPGTKSALLSQLKGKILPFVSCTSFFEPCSCFFVLFTKFSWFH